MPTFDHKNRADIRIIYGERQTNVRSALRNTVMSEGYRGIEDYGEVKPLESALSTGWPDLLVLDSGLPGGDCCALIESLRHNRTGDNPFVPVIFTLWNADSDAVERIVGCGVDDLLVNPISPTQLMSRIEFLVFNRKPFVVTSDYIGPDRRDATERDSEIPAIDVPNTLQQKAFGEKVDYENLRNSISDMLVTINEERLIRHSYQIAFLVRLITDGLAAEPQDERISEFITRLSDVARDVGERLAGSRYEHVSDLCETMIETAGRVALRAESPNPKDIELLSPLSDALIVGFNPDKQAADMASEINGMLSNFAARSA
ncbi:MAG TPA: hypothetical protein DCS82_12075 [Rhodospirillaceae bacterium]|nr:hypothetical protein [Rhodospirillaceae bacterium]HAA93499.1 hypothetical protein [Rhodospirillaceae bacterium]HAT36447.1 hypothetical protein [Rhodospirillaceae bacterium]